MSLIKNFKEIRRDGKIIDETMTSQELASKGWGVDLVESLTWLSDNNKKVTVSHESGILSNLIEDRSAIACIFFSEFGDSLKILNADGTDRFIISNVQLIDRQQMQGSFEWFEPPVNELKNCFGVVFKDRFSERSYQLDIDVNTGKVMSHKQAI